MEETMRQSVDSFFAIGLILFSLGHACAQWEAASGSGLTSFTVSLSKGDTLLLADNADQQSVGCYRSVDNGVSWSVIDNLGPVVSFATDETVMYAMVAGLTVWVSTDGGNTWAQSTQGLFTGGAPATIICNKGNAITGSSTGLYFTSDHGASWHKATAGVPPTLVVNSLSASSQVALAFTDYGVFRSTNGGINWSLVNSGTYPLSPLLATDKAFYAWGPGGFVASTDSGASWVARPNAIPGGAGFAASGDTLFTYSSTGGGVYCSTDDGDNWVQVNTGLQNWYVQGLIEHNGYLFACTNWLKGVNYDAYIGLFRTEAGNILWRPLPVGLASVSNHSQTVFNLAYQNGVLFADGLFRSTDKGETWFTSDEGFQLEQAGGSALNMVAKDSLLFTMGGYKWIFRSADKGITWTPVNQQFTDANSYVTTLGVVGGVIFAGVGDEPYRSSDNGDSWAVCKTGMRRNLINRFVPSQHFIFAATDSGLHRSSDNGFTWNPIPFTSGLWGIVATDVVVAGSKIYVGTRQANSGIYVSTDEGNSWTLSNTGLQRTDLRWHFRTIGSRVFACGNWVYSSSLLYQAVETDSGTTWTPMWQDLGTSIFDIVADSTYAYIATGKGVFRRPLSDLTSVTKQWVKIPEAFAVSQNYPNPFNPSTRIDYDLPYRSEVFLTVYNTLGQKVVELVNGEMDAGHHEVQFDGTHLASGVYFYRFQAGTFLQTKRLMLLK
jgi:photosystem II stability/assembly factor-like uncharacterized protein